ncbi:hypothetical protein QE152_g4539 [Popillia japonica]|uniref:Uncharacterized protein n=1 Tax=Popillia japonica TaxID=7064 RepID=A0AAW1N071_POPJA
MAATMSKTEKTFMDQFNCLRLGAFYDTENIFHPIVDCWKWGLFTSMTTLEFHGWSRKGTHFSVNTFLIVCSEELGCSFRKGNVFEIKIKKRNL